MTRMLIMAAMFGLAVTAGACTHSNSSMLLAEGQPILTTDVPEGVGSTVTAPVSNSIDFHDSRTYGNYGG
jgi:hypothetical protein